MPKLLIIDDEPNVRFSISQVFTDETWRLFEAENAEEALRIAAEESPQVILLDIRLGNCSGLDLFEELREIDPKCLVIFITGHGTAETAIEAMKRGAYDYLVKPLDASQLRSVVEQAFAISRLMHVPAIAEESDRPESTPDRLIGSGPAMQAVFKHIGRVASQDVNVLILGESGTGKELVARAIYNHSRRSRGPFLAINCAAIPETLLESELFGYERGAFTGADRRRIGKFEQSDGGTLFLDEVGDMSPGTQAKILRLLQEGCFERVGGSESIKVDVRILAATNQNLEKLIAKDLFRKDLYYRLCGVTIRLPPLRERRDDVAELAHYFLFRENKTLRLAAQSISAEALALLEQYDWPGNVRQLQSVIREALIKSVGPAILPEFLSEEVQLNKMVESMEDAAPCTPESLDWQSLPHAVEAASQEGANLYRNAVDSFDRLIIAYALQQCEGKLSRAAELLGLSRVTLRAKMNRLGMSVSRTLTNSPAQDRTE